MEGPAGGLGWRGWVKLLASGWLGWQVMPEDGRRFLMQLVDQLLTTPAPDTKALPPPQVTPIAPITSSAELESTYTVSESKGPESLDDIIGRALLKLGAPLPPLHVPSPISTKNTIVHYPERIDVRPEALKSEIIGARATRIGPHPPKG